MLQDCEEWDRQQGTWHGLPSMLNPRSLFDPCEFHCLLYMCGYGSNCIEVFHPVTRLFTVISTPLPHSSGCLSVRHCDQLFIVSNRGVSIWKEEKDTGLVHVRTVDSPQQYYMWSCTLPVVDEVNGVLFTVDSGVCFGIHLENGSRRQLEKAR